MNVTILAALIGAVATIIAAIIAAIVALVSRSKFQDRVTLLEVQKGRRSMKLAELKGTGSNVGMVARIENRNNQKVTVINQRGTVISSQDPMTQKMIANRDQAFDVNPNSSEEFDIATLCLEAFKDPPRKDADGNHKVRGVIGNRKILKLFDTIAEVEEKISDNIVSVDANGFRSKSMEPILQELARGCEFTRNDLRGGYKAKILSTVIQCALWQLTDKLTFGDYVKIISKSKRDRVSISEIDDFARKTANLSRLLLERAKLTVTMKI